MRAPLAPQPTAPSHLRRLDPKTAVVIGMTGIVMAAIVIAIANLRM